VLTLSISSFRSSIKEKVLAFVLHGV
jgi:hypothetical protein